MQLSVFDMFKIGIGPSSSHTVGPMRAARRFAESLVATGRAAEVGKLTAELFGSLGFTGRGHGSDLAVTLGLEGEEPERVDPDVVPSRMAKVSQEGRVALMGKVAVPFAPKEDIVFHRHET